MKHAVVLGDPAHFRIKGGLNPYTRTRWGFRKKVDSAKARAQWNAFRATLERLGAEVHVFPAQADHPGSVFPANAGFLHPQYAPIPWSQKTFYLSNPAASHRRGESSLFKGFLENLGLRTAAMPHVFEGEADFFPAGEFYLFTNGPIVPNGFRPALGLPPWRFQFSHRSDARNLKRLEEIVAPVPVIELRLVDPRYYHGDTALFAFGKKREFLFAYFDAMDAVSQARLRKAFGSKVFALSQADTERFAANSFQLDTADGPHLIVPCGLSEEFLEKVRASGLPHTEVDVSEFFEKGGGSIKCLLADLGPKP